MALAKKEIFLGALCGVLIGFNPVFGLSLGLMILITLLLNANIGFTLLGLALGKTLSLLLSVVSFHTGFFLIHQVGLEGMFAFLANTPVTALMDLDVYAMIGSLPYALIIGIAFAQFMAATVTKIREQMVKAGENETISKAVNTKFSKFLLWLAFGKQKLSTADVLSKQSPLLRKSGFILITIFLAIGLLLEFLLMDKLLKRGVESAIAAGTGAEVNVESARFSIAGGKLELSNLEVTDPNKPSHNMVQIQQLSADLSINELLRRNYAIDRLAGSVVHTDVERTHPGEVYETVETVNEVQAPKSEDEKSFDDYLAQAEKWKRYAQKLQEYLSEREARAASRAKNEPPEPSKKRALADAKRLGYLKARADLVRDYPTWTIRLLEIDQVELDPAYPLQRFQGSELSSHPELNGRPTSIAMLPMDSEDPTVQITLHFESPAAAHEILAKIENVDLADAIQTGEQLTIEKAIADLSAQGSFSTAELDIPFTVTIQELITDNTTINQLKEIELGGKVYGSLLVPKLSVDLDDQVKDAAINAAKAKAKEEAKKEADKQLNKALESDEAKGLKDTFKGLF